MAQPPQSRSAKRTIEGQEKQASVLLLADLEAAEVEWPSSPNDLRFQPLPPKLPRPYQREAIDKVVNEFDPADRGQLIMACGTGKILTALFIRPTRVRKSLPISSEDSARISS